MTQTAYNLFFNDAIHQALNVLLKEAREEVIISTATLKDMRLLLDGYWYGIWKMSKEKSRQSVSSSKNGRRYVALVDILNALQKRGLRIRVLASSERESVSRRIESVGDSNWLKICPRNHAKYVLADGMRGFLTSANLTGGGMGMHHSDRRNFEVATMLTSSQVAIIRDEFASIWTGRRCVSCRLSGKAKCCMAA